MKNPSSKSNLAAAGKAKEKINQEVKSILEDKRNLNKILDLQQNIENVTKPKKGVEEATYQASLRGLIHIMVTMIQRGDLDNDQRKDEAQEKFLIWIREQLDDLLKTLLEIIQTDNQTVLSVQAEFAMVGYFKILKAFNHRRLVTEGNKSMSQWSMDEIKSLRSLLPILCSKSKSCQAKIKRFQEYLEYADVLQHVVNALYKQVKQIISSKEEPNQHFKMNVMFMLEKIKLSKIEDPTDISTLLCNDDSTGKTLFNLDFALCRKNFSDLWDAFCKFEMDSTLYKRVLIMLSDEVMPYLTRPLLFTDFLLNSYKIGGVISVLALNGVFTLMQKYNLEYPDFYSKLYALFQPDILAAKYRARFFYLADIFLTSTHIPEYMIAAFIKRLARMCLTAPANSILLALPFIGNLLLRHSGLLKMLRGENEVQELDNDPYDYNQLDLAKCGAINSHLWEIITLQNHILPQVAQTAKNLVTKKLPEMEWDLSEFLELDMEKMMEIERKKKIFVNVPLTFEKPIDFKLQKNEITSKYFDIC